jgi:hypothetical protein
MRRFTMILIAAALLACIGWASPAQDKSGLTDDGFITTWLLLAPIPLDDNQSGGDALNKQQIKDEAKLTPKAGDKVKGQGLLLRFQRLPGPANRGQRRLRGLLHPGRQGDERHQAQDRQR